MWPVVLIVTPSPTRSTLLRTATERVIKAQFDDRTLMRATEFAFCDLPTLVREGPLAPIWHRAGATSARALLDDD